MAASPQSFSTPHTNRSHHLWNWAPSVMGCPVVETWKNTCQIDLRSVRHSSPLSRPMPDPILSNSLSLRDCPLHSSSYSGAAWLEDMTQSAAQDLAPEARYGRALSVSNSRGIFKTCSASYQITPVTSSSPGLTHGRQRRVTQPEPPPTKEHTLEVHIKLRSVILSIPWKEPQASDKHGESRAVPVERWCYEHTGLCRTRRQ